MSDSHEPSRYLNAEWVAYLNDEGEEVNNQTVAIFMLKS